MRGVPESSASSPVATPALRSLASTPSPQNRFVLLVIDDDDGVREALHLILDDDYSVLDVADGRTALSMIRVQRVDLVLLDILMPDIDGIEILKELKAFKPDLPVVMMTAVKTVRTVVAAMKLGAVEYITKPFQEPELLATIGASLAERRARRTVRPSLAYPDRQARRLHSHRLLLVEGDLGWRAALAVTLERVARVETASTFLEALNRVLRFGPTCVVLNVRRSSAEAARFLGAVYAQLPTCSALVLSDDPHQQATLAWKSLNILGVMRPPVDPGELLSRIAATVALGVDEIRCWPRLTRPVSRTIDYVSAHFGDDLNVGGLAEVAGISGSHLSHLFRAEIGMTLREYLTRVRVEITRDLLAHTNENLANIAAFVGFFDASHLSRVFRQIKGKRPNVYRRSSVS
jgi:DNA-binding response OmpR family regulator/AraC-like DNA-binding protein